MVSEAGKGPLTSGRVRKSRPSTPALRLTFCAALLIRCAYRTKSLNFQMPYSDASENAIKADGSAESLELSELGAIPRWLEP